MKSKSDAMKDVGTVLDTKVYIEKRTVTNNDKRVQKETWDPYGEVWAQKNKLFGKEYFAAKSLGEEKTIKFKMRKGTISSKLNPVDFRMKVNEDGLYVIYDIKDTDPIPNSLWIVISGKARM
ncbi:MAG: phage head closure protein [Clostridia bacterium]|nr:phage head closure protein [Clostridia bacterium]